MTMRQAGNGNGLVVAGWRALTLLAGDEPANAGCAAAGMPHPPAKAAAGSTASWSTPPLALAIAPRPAGCGSGAAAGSGRGPEKRSSDRAAAGAGSLRWAAPRACTRVVVRRALWLSPVIRALNRAGPAAMRHRLLRGHRSPFAKRNENPSLRHSTVMERKWES